MLSKSFYGAALALVSFSAVAAAQTTPIPSTVPGASIQGAATATAAPAAPGAIAPAKAASAADMNFVKTAAQAGLSEVMEGQLAQQKGNAKVQQLGSQMAADHTKANDQLKTLAQGMGMDVPSAPNAAQQAEYSKLQGMSGAGFDSAYLTDQHKAHLQAISLFKLEASAGKNPQLKAFASQTLPTLEEHLKMIRAAQSKGSNS